MSILPGEGLKYTVLSLRLCSRPYIKSIFFSVKVGRGDG